MSKKPKKDKKNKKSDNKAKQVAESEVLSQATEESVGLRCTPQPQSLEKPFGALGISVGMVEQNLLSQFPEQTALPWDRTGLLVGDIHQPVTAVAVALDATVEAVRGARACGANVLITHHPAFLEPPAAFGPHDSDCPGSGAVVWEAITQGVALMNFHTALDVSKVAHGMLPGMLSLDFKAVFEPLAGYENLGFGQLCEFKSSEKNMSLRELAARCTSVFGRAPRVWGNFDTELKNVVCATGSAGDMPLECVRAGVSCLVCGEVKYHSALDAAAAGLCIIELGHDVSELPFTAVLARAAEKAGVPENRIVFINQGNNWTYPEATRR